MNIRIDLEIKYSAENGSYFRVAEKLNLFCLWGIHLCSISFFFFAMAKLISFTKDYIKKNIFNQFESSKALIVVSWRSGRGGRRAGTWM